MKTCAARICRTSLGDNPVACGHGFEFCESCAPDETCSECAARLDLVTEAHRIADANGGIVAASTLERRLRLGHSQAVRIAAIVNGECA